MSPERAILPIVPDPGSTSRRFSSNTTVLPSTLTVGPLFIAVPPLVMVAIPLLPDSEEPTASVITRLGKWRKNSSLTGAEKSAADDVTASKDERS